MLRNLWCAPSFSESFKPKGTGHYIQRTILTCCVQFYEVLCGSMNWSSQETCCVICAKEVFFQRTCCAIWAKEMFSATRGVICGRGSSKIAIIESRSSTPPATTGKADPLIPAERVLMPQSYSVSRNLRLAECPLLGVPPHLP
jgi:hypothetical protein